MDPWKLFYKEWKPKEQGRQEALLTLGNGYFATRGAAEEAAADDINYPGTYLAGGYNRLTSEIEGTLVENEDFVNWPNWLHLTFSIEGGPWFKVEEVQLHHYYKELDLQQGLLTRVLRFEDNDGNITSLTCKRLVSMHNQHLAAIQWILEPVNWSGEIKIRSGLDGNIVNQNVDEHTKLNNKHLELVSSHLVEPEGIYLKVKTNQSEIVMAQAARTCFYKGEQRLEAPSQLIKNGRFIAQEFTLSCTKAQSLVIEKTVSLYTSRDWAISEPGLEAHKALKRAGRFAELLAAHIKAWKQLWNRCNIEITESQEALPVLRLHIFHLLQTASFHTIDIDTGVTARGLHGEGYRGHIFWDELFIFPFFNMRIPELTRELIMYRYRRLEEARHIARKAGCRGACFPWQSGSDGQEETSSLLLNPMNNTWNPDHTYLQRHINAAIAYNVWQYYLSSNDLEFMYFYGARLFLEIALFWSSLASFSKEKGKYELKGVIGPDEYHTCYPGADKPGLHNNAYTNIMAAWVLKRASDVLQLFTEANRAELLSSLDLDEQELNRWQEISSTMYIPFQHGNIISQFEGYEDLKELDWDKYKKKYGEHLRLDFILDYKGDSVNNYKASKQADVLMLFYIFTNTELKELFEHMGYTFSEELVKNNIDYYRPRNAHGSTLSKLVESWILARIDRKKSWDYFLHALKSDVEDIQGGSTQEGIHLGAMAGTLDLIQRCYTGMEIKGDVIWLDPHLPEDLEHIKMRLFYKAYWFTLHINHHKMEVYFEGDMQEEIKIGFRGKIHSSKNNDTLTFNL